MPCLPTLGADPPVVRVPTGFYAKLNSDWRSGGSSRHEVLASRLRVQKELKTYRVHCVVDVDGYDAARRRSVVTNTCAGSSYVLVGPLPDAESVQKLIQDANLGTTDLYVYVEAVRCGTTCEPIPKTN